MVDNLIIGKYLFLSILILGVFYSLFEEKKIQKNPKFVNGQIYKTSTSKSGAVLNYKFYVNSISYEGTTSFGGAYSEVYKKFINKQFLVVYEELNPKNNELLLIKSDYKKYKLDYPDSINWVQRYYEW